MFLHQRFRKASEKTPNQPKESAAAVPQIRTSFRAPAPLSDALDAIYARNTKDAKDLKRANAQRRYAQDGQDNH